MISDDPAEGGILIDTEAPGSDLDSTPGVTLAILVIVIGLGDDAVEILEMVTGLLRSVVVVCVMLGEGESLPFGREMSGGIGGKAEAPSLTVGAAELLL